MDYDLPSMGYLIFLFILGTVVGSFINVCIHRLPRGESIVFPPSHCPACQHKLGFWDLIPILGYIFLKGKCRYCRSPISLRYPLVEFTNGILFASIAVAFPPGAVPLHFMFYLMFSILMLIIFFTDLEQQVVPDSLSVTGIFLGLSFAYLKGMFWQRELGAAPFNSSLAGMLLGYFILYLIAKAGKAYFKKEVMGEGDLYLAAMLGACLGWQGMLVAVFLAYLMAGAVLAVPLFLGKVKLGQQVPFGPALVGGGFASLFFGSQIMGWYLGLLL